MAAERRLSQESVERERPSAAGADSGDGDLPAAWIGCGTRDGGPCAVLAAAESVSGNGRDFRGRCRERGRALVALSNAGGFSPACFSLARLVGLAETENQA
jgi:hypothetical protein